MVDASGDIVWTNAPPGKNGWTIGINQPGESDKLLENDIEVANCSVSPSGLVYQYMEHEGKRYSHIINPKPAIVLLSAKCNHHNKRWPTGWPPLGISFP